MGLGRLNPGCKDECGCQGCFGSITQQGNCQINWTTSGDPFAVQLRLGVDVVSNAESGSLYSPDSGTYTLWIKCGASDDWVLADSFAFTLPVSGCFSCCDGLGDAPIGGDTTTVELDIAGEPWATWFAGSYVLDKLATPCAGASNLYNVCGYKLHRCAGNALIAGISYPYGLVGSPSSNVANRCRKNLASPLFSLGFYAGTITQNVSQGTRIYEVWYWPRSLTIDVLFGPNATFGASFRRQSAVAVMVAECYFVRIDELFNNLGQACSDNSGASVTVSGTDIPCGNSLASNVGYVQASSPLNYPGLTNIPQIPVTLATLTIYP